MKCWFKVYANLVALHTVLALTNISHELGFITMYLPLIPFEQLGVQVLDTSQAYYFPPPNTLGWILLVFGWLVLHSIFAYFVCKLFALIKRNSNE